MAALEQAHRRDGAQDPREFGDRGHVALTEKAGPRGVEPAGEEVDGEFAAVAAQGVAVANGRERVEIGDEIKRLAFFLQLDGGPHHSKVIAQVEFPRGLDAGQNSHGRERAINHNAPPPAQGKSRRARGERRRAMNKSRRPCV
jgi:hypothetical protein